MKKQISAILFLLISLQGVAQLAHVKHLTTFDDKKIHFGFSIGINTMDFSLRHWSLIGKNPDFVEKVWGNPDGHEITASDNIRAGMPDLVPGLTVGIVTNLRLGEYFDLRVLPGLSFGERKLVYNVPVYDNNAGNQDVEFYSTKATFIDLPVLVKYKSSRLNNQRPYLIAGPALRLDISKSGSEELVRTKRAGFYLEGGIGLDSYLRFFRLSTELKVSLGLGNILGDAPDETQRAYYTHAIQRMTSNVFTLSFHFE
ncbi:porin family protein [Gaoshiqia sediminis]|uniref:PorT family protein n=1 Tax=Gaoshiqia sediminis TaxID=2986998 RepID=A0AA41Y6H9_9BACT|nr:porin family protein [Gaoshiqia sediminis]MCW0482745.1 PorT family protein [Gaoshiqia sediminis]